jgi:flagellar protein FlaJ
MSRRTPKRTTSTDDSYSSVQPIVLAPYRLLGSKLERLIPLFGGLERQLLRANAKIAFPAYATFLMCFSCLGGLVIFVLTALLGLMLGVTLTASFGLASLLGLLGSLALFGVMYMYPTIMADYRGRILDNELPYLASHMAVLSRAGLPPEKIFRSMTQVEAAGIRSVAAEEALNITRDVQLLGFDTITAMERRMKNSPSSKFVDFVDGFVSVGRSGGDLTSYFLSSAKGFMDSARISAKQLVETLGGLAEAYVSMMVVFPLLVIVMLSIMSMIGGSIEGLSTLFIMQLVTYVAIPMLASVILLIVDSVTPPR